MEASGSATRVLEYDGLTQMSVTNAI